MKKVLILILTIFSFNSFSQSEKWENLMEIEGVKIDKTIIECGVNELITFRFSNLNNYNVSVTFYEEVWVDGQCKQDGFSEENYRELSLKANEIISDLSSSFPIPDCLSFFITVSAFNLSVVLVIKIPITQ